MATGEVDGGHRSKSERQKRYYLEDPKRDACVGREPDAPVGQVENEYRGHEHPHPPRNVYTESVLEGVSSGRGEDKVEKRGDEWFGQEKCPPDQEADLWSEGAEYL